MHKTKSGSLRFLMNNDLRKGNTDSFLIKTLFDRQAKLSADPQEFLSFGGLADRDIHAVRIESADAGDFRLAAADIRMFLCVFRCDLT